VLLHVSFACAVSGIELVFCFSITLGWFGRCTSYGRRLVVIFLTFLFELSDIDLLSHPFSLTTFHKVLLFLITADDILE